MPKVKDETGNVVAELPYTPEGESQAEEIAAENPSWDVDYAPGGSYDAGGRVKNIPGYFGGGMVADYMGGYSPTSIEGPPDPRPRPNPRPEPPMYKEGGKVKKK
jgi:hypothetical protein